MQNGAKTSLLCALGLVFACRDGAALTEAQVPFDVGLAPDAARLIDDDAGTLVEDAGLEADAGPQPLDATVVEDGGTTSILDSGPAPVAADPGAPGPHGVGVRTVELTDAARQRTFKVDLWYPIAPAPCVEPNTYELGENVTLFRMETPACRDAVPLAMGPLPIVLFSHGFGGVRFQSYFMTEHLASHGFLVASPDHPGNRLTDFASLGSDEAALQSSMDRPLDLLFVLDHLVAGGEVDLSIDATRVAASGHSFGGWTSLEVARRDPRIKVVAPLAPGFRQGATIDFVADLHRPVIFIGGSEDQTCEFEANQRAPYQIAATPKALLEVLGAGHLDFSNLCDIPIARIFVDDGCDPQLADPAMVQARVLRVLTAFLEKHLAGRPGLDPHLEPATIEALGDVQLDYEP